MERSAWNLFPQLVALVSGEKEERGTREARGTRGFWIHRAKETAWAIIFTSVGPPFTDSVGADILTHSDLGGVTPNFDGGVQFFLGTTTTLRRA